MFFEHAADTYLRHLGYRCLERNFFSKSGECDWIGVLGRTLVFVEVRGRTSATPWISIEDAFSQSKILKWRKTIQYYLFKKNALLQELAISEIRLDLVAIKKIARGEGWPLFSLEHFPGVVAY